MSIQMVLFVVGLSAGELSVLPPKAQELTGLAVHRGERVAQGKSDPRTAPGGIPGRSESSEEARPSTRGLKKSKKPAGQETDTKNKEAPRKGEKKDPQ